MRCVACHDILYITRSLSDNHASETHEERKERARAMFKKIRRHEDFKQVHRGTDGSSRDMPVLFEWARVEDLLDKHICKSRLKSSCTWSSCMHQTPAYAAVHWRAAVLKLKAAYSDGLKHALDADNQQHILSGQHGKHEAAR